MREIIAAIDIETTGLAPRHHDIIEIAIQPLDEAFEPSGEIPAFVARIKVRRPQNASARAMEVNGLDLNEGDEYHEALARLLSWLEEHRIGKIDALGQNVDFDRSFIEANIPELGRLLGHRFLRDSQRLACAYNDLVRLRTGKPAFKNLVLSDLRKALGIERARAHRVLDDARDAARVYKALLERMIFDV
jgi:DNA polymerase III epsilon subunit-like protein